MCTTLHKIIQNYVKIQQHQQKKLQDFEKLPRKSEELRIRKKEKLEKLEKGSEAAWSV